MRKLFLLLLYFSSVLSWAAIAGRIEAYGGSISRKAVDGRELAIAQGQQVEVGDTLVTGANGWLVLAMVDGASLTLKANSSMRVDDYRFSNEQPSESRSWLTLLQGALRSISGAIASSHKPAYRLATPTATIGIRGTDHETLVVDDDNDPSTPAGTYNQVMVGETVLARDGVEQAIRAGETGFIGKLLVARPQLLNKVPERLQKLRDAAREQGIDGVLDKLHERVDGGFRAKPLSGEQLKQLGEGLRQQVDERREDGKPARPPAELIKKLPPKVLRTLKNRN